MLNVTDRAVSALKSVVSPEFAGLRIMVSSGCSGLNYTMGLDGSGAVDGDEIVEVAGVKVFIDNASVVFLTGATMDFVDGEEGSGFVFDNPNATAKSCSCNTKTC